MFICSNSCKWDTGNKTVLSCQQPATFCLYNPWIIVTVSVKTLDVIELCNIMILSFIMILKCHDNLNRREIFNIVISPTQYYRKYLDYQMIHCSETFISVKYFQLIFTILVLVALLSDIVIISIIMIITLMIYRDMKFLLSPIPTMLACKFWPIFQRLKSYNSVTAEWNVTKLCSSIAKWSSYILVEDR